MLDGSKFNSAGAELNRMMDNLGFPDQVGDVCGAALDAAVGNNTGVARNLLDAYSGLSTSQLDAVVQKMSLPAFMARPGVHYPSHAGQVQGYAGAALPPYPNPAQMQQILGSFLNRVAEQNFGAVLQQIPGSSAPQGQSVPETLGRTLEQMLAQLENKLESKMNAPVQGKKRKKKGGLSKIKKSFKKKFKSVAKFAKNAFKSTFKSLSSSFTNIFKSLQSGNFLEFGRALTGGLIGGPMGNLFLEQLMKAGGKNNPFQQVFRQVHQSFDLIGGVHRHQADLQRALVNRFIR